MMGSCVAVRNTHSGVCVFDQQDILSGGADVFWTPVAVHGVAASMDGSAGEVAAQEAEVGHAHQNEKIL